MRRFLATGVVWVIISSTIVASAQNKTPAFGFGLQLNSMRMNTIGEGAIGARGVFNYRRTSHLAFEAIVDHFPENSAGNFGETQCLFGALVGKSFNQFGIFAKARAGFIHFGGEYFALRLDDKTHPSIDLGGVVEYYPSRNIVLRFEAGDTAIAYGNSEYLSGPVPNRLGTLHNLGASVGIGIRF